MTTRLLRRSSIAIAAVTLLPAATMVFGEKNRADVAALSRTATAVEATALTAEQCVLIQIHSELPHGLWSSPSSRFESDNDGADCAVAPQRVPVRRTVPIRRVDEHS